MPEDLPSSINQQLINQLAFITNVSEAQLLEQWESAAIKNNSFRQQLADAGLIKEQEYQQAVSEITKLEFADQILLLEPEYQDRFTQTIPIRFAKKYLFYPFIFNDDQLVFAILNPWPNYAFEEAASALNFSGFSLVLSTQEAILEAINQGYDRSGSSAEEAAEVLVEEADLNYLDHFSYEETEDLLEVEDEEPIKKLMNSIIFQSVKGNSSDIHIDPTPKETVVRNRVDGILHQITTVPKAGHVPLVNRVKVMASLDIATKNQPQDGRTMILLAGEKIDIRVSIIPTVHGEQAVLRLLNQSQGIIPLKKLGLTKKMSEQIDQLTHQPHGIILVTGPTGSGKTTTLYSALNRLNAKQKNIVTIEDPVEYRINNYGQMQVSEKTGVTFAKGLRAMLRQDPDVIMIGEIRDSETAQIAIQASLTGHLVLSTLHTNEAASTIIRLIDMGIEPYLVSSTVTAVLAQRLVRKICSKCKEAYSVSWDELAGMNLQDTITQDEYSGMLWKGKGCSQCLNTGYQGRIGIFELLILDDAIRNIINKSTDSTVLKQTAKKAGMMGLKYDCAKKVIDGITTYDEMLRAVFMEQEI